MVAKEPSIGQLENFQKSKVVKVFYNGVMNSPYYRLWWLLQSFLVVSCLTILMSLPALAKLNLGDSLPTISGHVFNKETFSTKEWQGKVILINFWASWCEPCKEELPLLQSFYQTYHAKGLEILTISMDKPADMVIAKKLIATYPFTNAYKEDLTLQEFGRIWRIPSTFIINRQGIIVKDGLKGEPLVNESFLRQVVLPLIENTK